VDVLGIDQAQGKILLKSKFANQSVKDYRVETFATIRTQTNKLVQKVRLNSLSAWQKKSTTSLIFPENEVNLVGELDKVTAPGTYNVVIASKINGKRQVTARGEIKVTPDMIKTTAATTTPKEIFLTPVNLTVLYTKGRPAMFRFQIDNPTNSEVTVTLPDAQKDEQYGDFKFFPSKFKIRPNSAKMAIFKATAKKDGWSLPTLSAAITDDSGNAIRSLALPFKLEKKQ
jgi:hypothetical protein